MIENLENGNNACIVFAAEEFDSNLLLTALDENPLNPDNTCFVAESSGDSSD